MNIHIELLRLTQRVEALEKQMNDFNDALGQPEPEKKSAPQTEQRRKTG